MGKKVYRVKHLVRCGTVQLKDKLARGPSCGCQKLL